MKKVILITGSTDGIGKLAALKLAREGHTMYLHGRNADKLERVIEELKSDTNNQNINGFVADFSDLHAVRKMSEEIKMELSSIDVLVNNAGIFKVNNNITDDGLDVRMAVNYLAPYILTNALLPLLRQSDNPRIINLSSAAQSSVSTEFLKGNKQLPDQAAYAQSKLAILMWSFHLAEQEPDITAIPLNPGSLLNTNMVREAYGKFWSSADKGADIIVDLSISQQHDNMSGKYFDNDKGGYGKTHPDAYDKGIISGLIEVTEDMVGSNK
ncbi:MAG: SDR family NAD(P)-dependent oxidoreductase [Saprospiraceae bacterium]|nr:SDR family NAD(P)-dependent oxidoreductase [Saprospiraceae bacterium]